MIVPAVPSRTADVVVVLEVMRQLVHLDRAEAGFVHQLLGFLASPHGAETLAVLGERDGHAMHARYRVQKRADRVLAVELNMARALDVLRKVDAIGREREADAAQDGARVRLVMDGVEGGDEVESRSLGLLIEAAQIARKEDDIAIAPALRLLAAEGDGVVGEVQTDEPAVGKPSGHHG